MDSGYSRTAVNHIWDDLYAFMSVTALRNPGGKDLGAQELFWDWRMVTGLEKEFCGCTLRYPNLIGEHLIYLPAVFTAFLESKNGYFTHKCPC